MNFNVEEILKGLTEAMHSQLTVSAAEVQKYATLFWERRNKRLQEIARLYSEKLIREDQLHEELSDEGRLLEAQLLAIHAMGKASAQKAAHAAIDFLFNYLLKWIKPI